MYPDGSPLQNGFPSACVVLQMSTPGAAISTVSEPEEPTTVSFMSLAVTTTGFDDGHETALGVHGGRTGAGRIEIELQQRGTTEGMALRVQQPTLVIDLRWDSGGESGYRRNKTRGTQYNNLMSLHSKNSIIKQPSLFKDFAGK